MMKEGAKFIFLTTVDEGTLARLEWTFSRKNNLFSTRNAHSTSIIFENQKSKVKWDKHAKESTPESF